MKAVESATNTLPVEQQFITDLCYSIETDKVKNSTRLPSKTFKPSSIGGCKRNIYFQLIGEELDNKKSSFNLIGIEESGTDRHIRLQTDIINMITNGIDCEYVDIEDFVKQRNLTDIEIVEKSGIETKCYNKKYNISFLTDGIIKYKGKYYILEIKTETSRKFWDHDYVRKEHIAQGVTYYISFGINQVMYLYENRDNLDKKAYVLNITEDMVEEILDVMNDVNYCILNKTIPDKQVSNKCTYCDYTKACAKCTN